MYDGPTSRSYAMLMSLIAQYITFDDQRSSGLIKGIQFGIIAPGVSASKTLYLVGSGAPGDRMIDISIQSTSVQVASMTNDDDAEHPRSSSSSSTHAAVDACEKLQTILIPMSRALSVTYDVSYRRSKNAIPAEDDVWGDSYGGVAIITARIECSAPCGLLIEGLKLHRQVGEYASIATAINLSNKDNSLAQLLDSTCDEGSDDMFLDGMLLVFKYDLNSMKVSEYLPGDEFCDVSRISLSPQEEQVLTEEKIPGPGDYEVTWRR